jgi:DNA-binding MarR family transcriptional regulator
MLSSKQVLDQLILETFRLHGALIAAGDALVGDLGLTSARWQVLGAVAKAEEAPSLSGVARAMGLSRQAVRRLVNDMEEVGLLATEPHPVNRRLRLVVLTQTGQAAHKAADERQVPWGDRLARGLDARELTRALKILQTLRQRLDPEE